MENEYLHEEAEHKEEGIEERENITDDLKFMRTAVEKTYKQIVPDTHPIIMWGIICLIAYPTIHFLGKFQHTKWILPFFLSLMVFGLSYIFITLFIFIPFL